MKISETILKSINEATTVNTIQQKFEFFVDTFGKSRNITIEKIEVYKNNWYDIRGVWNKNYPSKTNFRVILSFEHPDRPSVKENECKITINVPRYSGDIEINGCSVEDILNVKDFFEAIKDFSTNDKIESVSKDVEKVIATIAMLYYKIVDKFPRDIKSLESFTDFKILK